MKLDTEQQRELLLQLIVQATIPGAAIEVVYDLKKSIESADISSNSEGREEANG